MKVVHNINDIVCFDLIKENFAILDNTCMEKTIVFIVVGFYLETFIIAHIEIALIFI